jgi:hypothetical protein
MNLNPNCREAARLMSERLDRPLNMAERLALGVHLRVCEACPRFDAQMRFLRGAMRGWKEQAEDGADERLP